MPNIVVELRIYHLPAPVSMTSISIIFLPQPACLAYPSSSYLSQHAWHIHHLPASASMPSISIIFLPQPCRFKPASYLSLPPVGKQTGNIFFTSNISAGNGITQSWNQIWVHYLFKREISHLMEWNCDILTLLQTIEKQHIRRLRYKPICDITTYRLKNPNRRGRVLFPKILH